MSQFTSEVSILSSAERSGARIEGCGLAQMRFRLVFPNRQRYLIPQLHLAAFAGL